MNIDIFTFSDESGVFDYKHNSHYVFGGLIILGKPNKDDIIRKYRKAESVIAPHYPEGMELKASNISCGHRAKLFRSLNSVYKFGVIINQNEVHKQIFSSKKSKQRYLDFAYKMGVKHALVHIMNVGAFSADDVRNMFFYVDEHTTATDGRYELREGLLQEFKEGTFNYLYQKYFPPIFPNMNSLDLQYCNSKKSTLVRAADIVANRVFHEVESGNNPVIRDNLFISVLPQRY